MAKHSWIDREAGPVVRAYTMTRGRVRPATGTLDMVAFVMINQEEQRRPANLQPEQRAILELVRAPLTVVEIASNLDLALGVVRVLLGDLHKENLITMYEPPIATQPASENILQAVIDALRAI